MRYSSFLKSAAFFAIHLFASCKPDGHTVIIKGDIKGLDAKWVYLNNVYPVGSKSIDSAKVRNGTFSFTFHADTVIEPRLIFLWYKDRITKGKYLCVNNPFISKRINTDFVMEPGVTELTGHLTKNGGLTITSGTQNNFSFKNNDLPFVSISENEQKHKQQVNNFIQKIKHTPNAWYALFALENWKYSVTNEELTQLFNAFDEQIKQTYSARKIKAFIDARPNENAPRPNPMLIDNYGKTIPMIDTSKKLNMVILWASWCGPCKEEIPLFKQIAIKFKNNDFRMVSISIDKDKTKWKQELDKQTMPWQQLVVPTDGYQHILDQYNLNSVPRVYFIDKNRKLVKFIGGYNPANKTFFEQTITDYLKI